MTVARKFQVSLEHTPYYHCTSRCVRRAFLCGLDRYSGKNFDHRRLWLEDRLHKLSEIFAIDLLAYAVMSNHYHVVLRLNPDQAASWSDDEIKARWGRLYQTPDTQVQQDRLQRWRDRLANLSWFMRCVNEPIARRANREDRCKGRFWEGRFRSQALLDETALLKCMAYVDLNPIRAGIARTPETSPHTSIMARIKGDDAHLLPFMGNASRDRHSIPIRREHYLELVDWTGRAIRADKRGAIPGQAPPILGRLASSPSSWTKEMRHYGHWYYRAVGSIASLQRYCEHLGQQWLKGQASAKAASATAG